MKLAIAFTMKELPELTEAAIRSIVTSYDHEVIVIDDWSERPETQTWLRAWDLGPYEIGRIGKVHVLTEPLTASLAGKWNIVAEQAWSLGCDAVLICNNDILFHPITIDAIVRRYLKGDVGMVSAHNLRSYVEPEELNTVEPPDFPTESDHPDFSCFLLPKSTWDIVGRFDENFQPCYFEDNDYHYRMKQAGLRAIATTSAIYYHYGSRTQNSVPGGLCTGYSFEQNRAYFVKKHHVDPSTYEPA